MRTGQPTRQSIRRLAGPAVILVAALLSSCESPPKPQPAVQDSLPSTLPAEHAPTTQPDEPGLAEGPYASAAEAALAAMLDADNIFAPPLAEVDRAATLAGLAGRRHRPFDLDGDGVDEQWIVLDRWVGPNGRENLAGDALDNRAWVIVGAESGGPWRVILRGHGSDTTALDSRHGGWRDLQSVLRPSEGVSVVTFYRHDEQSYRVAWAARVIGLDTQHAAMQATAIPEDVLMGIVHDVGPQEPQQVEVVHGAAFRGDLDENGADELLVQLDSLRVDGQTIHPVSTDDPGNLYLYTWRNGSWERLLRTKNIGDIRMPLAVDSPGLMVLETLTHRNGQEVTIQWYHLRDGQIVDSGTRRRSEP